MSRKCVAVFPYSRLLGNGRPNPKHYPLMPDVVEILHQRDVRTIQVSAPHEMRIGCGTLMSNLSTAKLIELGERVDAFLSIDSFFPHLAAARIPKLKGVVVWIVTSHEFFGYEKFTNIYATVPTLMPHQLVTMELGITELPSPVNIPPPGNVADAVCSLLTK